MIFPWGFAVFWWSPSPHWQSIFYSPPLINSAGNYWSPRSFPSKHCDPLKIFRPPPHPLSSRNMDITNDLNDLTLLTVEIEIDELYPRLKLMITQRNLCSHSTSKRPLTLLWWWLLLSLTIGFHHVVFYSVLTLLREWHSLHSPFSGQNPMWWVGSFKPNMSGVIVNHKQGHGVFVNFGRIRVRRSFDDRKSLAVEYIGLHAEVDLTVFFNGSQMLRITYWTGFRPHRRTRLVHKQLQAWVTCKVAKDKTDKQTNEGRFDRRLNLSSCVR